MKSILAALIISFSLALPVLAADTDAPKTKRVCKDSKDKKGKDVKVCKEIKIHKKVEGTQVPDGKKK